MSSQVPDAGLQPERNSSRSAISNAIVRIHAQYYGRGPTRARTHLSPDFALVVLEEVFTPAERTLIGAGQFAQVLNMRAAFQEVLRGEFVKAVEEISGRRVRAFMSQTNQDPEMAVELFIFEPNGDAEPPNGE
ncbi:MAG: hypothetical protein QOE06_861 [Thermoleophilaceae bacterium]|jgi:uncharacterized protein YbcI|nr:hypothetical protein [Thermoleophilaceae bacterium]